MKQKLLSEEQRKEYELLMTGRKNTVKTIILDEAKPNKDINHIKTIDVKHTNINKPMCFTAECSVCNDAKFGFKLIAKYFVEHPFFRFESSGTTHRNDYSDIPLKEQQICTPHYHKYDSRGRWIAYKTPALIAMNNARIEPEKCFYDFCQEVNLRYKGEQCPTIRLTPTGKLEFKDIITEDPLINITFVK